MAQAPGITGAGMVTLDGAIAMAAIIRGTVADGTAAMDGTVATLDAQSTAAMDGAAGQVDGMVMRPLAMAIVAAMPAAE